MLKVMTKLKSARRIARKITSTLRSNQANYSALDKWLTDLEINTADEQRSDTAARLLMSAARLSFNNPETSLAVFEKAQDFGVHFLKVHFYSTVPNTKEIPQGTFDRRYDHLPNLQIDRDKITEFLNGLAAFGAELDYIPTEKVEHQYYWSNPAFGGGDASLLYSMIRKYQPQTIIEIGCGFSTLMGLEACRKNGKGNYRCIEPFPNENIQYLAEQKQIELIQSPVQELPLETFDQLEAGDILFIDSTHVCKTGSDVIYEILRILPRVKPGVIIHVHDIFFPFEYPEHWVKNLRLFWTEAYLLMAFLAFNDSFEMLVPNQLLDTQEYQDIAKQTFPHSTVTGGGSFWFQRKA